MTHALANIITLVSSVVFTLGLGFALEPEDRKDYFGAILHWLGFLWALPTTLIGFTLYLVGGALPIRMESDGVIRFRVFWGVTKWAFARQWFGVYMVAQTIGACMLVADMAADNAQVIRHERRHYLQARRWGPCFLPAYFVSMLIASIQGKSAYRDNAFEVDAYAHEDE